jgi:hypothetical protein
VPGELKESVGPIEMFNYVKAGDMRDALATIRFSLSGQIQLARAQPTLLAQLNRMLGKIDSRRGQAALAAFLQKCPWAAPNFQQALALVDVP